MSLEVRIAERAQDGCWHWLFDLGAARAHFVKVRSYTLRICARFSMCIVLEYNVERYFDHSNGERVHSATDCPFPDNSCDLTDTILGNSISCYLQLQLWATVFQGSVPSPKESIGKPWNLLLGPV